MINMSHDPMFRIYSIQGTSDTIKPLYQANVEKMVSYLKKCLGILYINDLEAIYTLYFIQIV